ncbi:hypothetical protein FGB62_105g04 [Gracilaria domingensis]|nr:hypothetical protein FGB62_105g04 [Gracilaria domingensis]
MRHHASRALVKKGRYFPTHTSAPLSISRSNGFNASLFGTVVIAATLEMALDFSTGATTIWTTSTQTFRISSQVSNVSQFASRPPGFLAEARHALQRVEGTCYHMYDHWYSPVSFNMSNSAEFFNLADAALCPQNRSKRVNASSLITQSSFRAAHILETNIWNRTELKIGRDTHSKEEKVAYEQVGDVNIGALEKYSFVAANISDSDLIPGSERALTGNNSYESPRALQTARYCTSSGASLECFVGVNWKRDEDTGEWAGKEVSLHACLVPIVDNRSVLAFYDDVTGGDGEGALVMLVALQGVSTFRDLRVLKAMPFLRGRNNRMHTNRELAILAVLCAAMITAFATDGLQDVRLQVDGELVTVPTWNGGEPTGEAHGGDGEPAQRPGRGRALAAPAGAPARRTRRQRPRGAGHQPRARRRVDRSGRATR